MKTFIFPVIKTVKTTGHIRIVANTLDEATALSLNKDELKKGFVAHHGNTTDYTRQKHRADYQELLGDTE